jgi:hypothetical protein
MDTAYKTQHGAHDQVPNEDKLRQLTIYIASRSEEDACFSRIKLNKIIFYSDVMHYIRTGRSITGSAYIKMPYGPCPKSFHILEANMSSADELKIQKRVVYGHTQKRPIALVPPELSLFTAEEIATVDEMLQHFWGFNATEISDISHLFVGWQLAEQYETIPYSVARLGFDFDLTPFHYEIANKVAKRVASRTDES